MGEADLIGRTDRPATVDSMTSDLRTLGVVDGDVLIVHSSLSSLGWVAGGAHAVVLALLTAVGDDGTVVVPTHSTGLTDPSEWQNPPVPPEWIDVIRRSMPAFDRALTPTRSMGAIPECLRGHPRAIRSDHPTMSFTAVGHDAEQIVGEHPVQPELGETSPLGRLNDLDARILLLGVGHANDTSLHLAEHRAHWPDKRSVDKGAPVTIDGERRWVTWTDLDHDESDFGEIGQEIALSGRERVGRVGLAETRLVRQRDAVDIGVRWIESNRR